MGASVSVVVLSHNRPHLLRQSLAALERQTYPAASLEILVVDNRSAASDEIARVVAEHPRMRLVANAENLGFTGGMNTGLRQASGDLVYLTEDDIVLEPNNVVELVKFIEADPTAGIVSGMLLDEPTGSVWFAGGHVTLGHCLRLELPGRDEPNPDRFIEPIRVNYLCGATMLARRDFWRELGGFREDFFLYQEDIELSLRARRTGRDLVVVPAARCRHFRPQDGPFVPAIAYHKWKNLFALYVLHARPPVLPEFFVRCALQTFHRSPEEGGPPVEAWMYLARHLPALVRDRMRFATA
jgi:GT2 family glycosyltransferase